MKVISVSIETSAIARESLVRIAKVQSFSVCYVSQVRMESEQQLRYSRTCQKQLFEGCLQIVR